MSCIGTERRCTIGKVASTPARPERRCHDGARRQPPTTRSSTAPPSPPTHCSSGEGRHRPGHQPRVHRRHRDRPAGPAVAVRLLRRPSRTRWSRRTLRFDGPTATPTGRPPPACRAPKPLRSRCCTDTPTPSASTRSAAAVRPCLPRIAVSLSSDVAARVPRVRAYGNHRAQRLPRPGVRPLPRDDSSTRLREIGLPRMCS